VTIAHFGSFIIQINEPRVFLKRLNRIWEFHAWASASPSVFAVPVTYNKGEVLDFDPDFLAPPHYVYSQKPKKYADEKEWRYVFPCDPAVSKQVTDHTVLAIGDCHDICSLAKSAANTG
jgi:hypothetical protein